MEQRLFEEETNIYESELIIKYSILFNFKNIVLEKKDDIEEIITKYEVKREEILCIMETCGFSANSLLRQLVNIYDTEYLYLCQVDRIKCLYKRLGTSRSIDDLHKFVPSMLPDILFVDSSNKLCEDTDVDKLVKLTYISPSWDSRYSESFDPLPLWKSANNIKINSLKFNRIPGKH